MPSKCEIIEKLCAVVEEEAEIINRLVQIAEMHSILDDFTAAKITATKKDCIDVLGAWPEGGEECG